MKFDKNDIAFEGSSSEVWVIYKPFAGKDRNFIARFKYNSPKRNAKHFVKFLVENFSVEEYFEAAKNDAPLVVMRNKGYVSYSEEKRAA